jgi:hypothetical protein
MRIGALGWWNHDNQGDAAMLAALRLGFAPHHIVPIEVGFPANRDVLHRFNRLDFLLLGGGTLITGRPAPPFDTFDQWSAELRTPLGVIGLGVDSVAADWVSAVESLVRQARFFFVRDVASAEAVRDSRVTVAPDLTFAFPLPLAAPPPTREDPPACGVNLRRVATLDPEAWLHAIRALPVIPRGISLSTLPDWSEGALLRDVDPTTPDAFDPARFNGLSLMVATAYHAALFAIQSGVPTIAIDYAPKVGNFMMEAGLERYSVPPHDMASLAALVRTVVGERAIIANDLVRLRGEYQARAQAMLVSARSAVESAKPVGRDLGHPVRIYLFPGWKGEPPLRAASAVARQGYPRIEAMTLPDGGSVEVSPATVTDATTVAPDTLVTWLHGDAELDDDAIDCLASVLAANPELDGVYADYLKLDSAGRYVDYERVLPPSKLHRRNVVGPAFLVRSGTLARHCENVPADEDQEYAFWIRVARSGRLRPFGAALLKLPDYEQPPRDVAHERAVRHDVRRDSSVIARTAWRLIDSNFGERWIVRPAALVARRANRGR